MTARVPFPPNPWATTEPREALRDNNAGRIISCTPGANQMQVGSSSVPFFANMVDFCGHKDDYTSTVRFTGRQVLVKRSKTQHVHKGGHGGVCEPIGYARQVFAEGSPVTRNGDPFWMDDRQTVGEANYPGDTASYAAPRDPDRIPGSASTASAGAGASGFVQDVRYLDPAPPVTTSAPSVAPTAKPGLEPGRPGTPSGSGPWTTIIGGGIIANQAGQTAREYLAGDDAKTAIGVINDPGNSTSFGSGLSGKQAGEILVGSGNMGPSFSDQALIDDANARLSLKAGHPVDLREMSPEQIEELNRRPWPPAAQMQDTARQLEKNAQELERRKKQALIMPAPGDNVRVSEDKRRKRCKVGPYSEMKGYCSQYGMQAHHIVPDYTLRYGTRSEGESGIKRIPNSTLPTFQKGPCICLDGNAADDGSEHWEAHGADETIRLLGQRPGPPLGDGKPPGTATPLGTAPFTDVKDAAVDSILRVRPECVVEIGTAMDEAFGATPPHLLVRTDWPTTDEALGPLSRGELATLH